jgi:hypothetical protein
MIMMADLLMASHETFCTAGRIGHVHSTGAGKHCINATTAYAWPCAGHVLATVCCPSACDRCGGVDCWNQHGGLSCCAAHMHASGAPECLKSTDVGCIVPRGSIEIGTQPTSTSDEKCVDAWAMRYPEELTSWRGHSCAYKVTRLHSIQLTDPPHIVLSQ